MSKELEAYKIIEEEIIGSINDGRTKRIINLYKKQLEIIEEALKRNEPMRPIYEKDGTRSCPCCKGNWLTPNFKFCSDCGQKLDWSDEK